MGDANPSVSVLCAYPVSEIYSLQHRYVHYAALTFLIVAPVHRWMTPAAMGLVGMYSLFSTFYLIALFIAPTRLGPTLDIFPIHSILLTNTYAMATVVFCRSALVKPRRSFALFARLFVWLWGGFVLATLDKYSFEILAKKITKTVQCYADNSTSVPANVFSAGHGFACDNPCASSSADGLILHPAQGQIRPILWGTIDAATKSFSEMPSPSFSFGECSVVILFGIALSMTLWANFYTSPQTTRNTVFAIFTRERKDSRVRVAIAKTLALAWYTWSFLALLTIALAFPFVGYVQEQLLQR
jgi:hypothetical protein